MRIVLVLASLLNLAACSPPVVNRFWFDRPALVELRPTADGRGTPEAQDLTDCTPASDSWQRVPDSRQLPVNRGALAVWLSPGRLTTAKPGNVRIEIDSKPLATWREGTTLTEPSFLYSPGGFLQAGLYLTLSSDTDPRTLDLSCRQEPPAGAALAATLRSGEPVDAADWIALETMGWDARPALPLPPNASLVLSPAVAGAAVEASVAVACRSLGSETSLQVRTAASVQSLTPEVAERWLHLALEPTAGPIEIMRSGSLLDRCFVADPSWLAGSDVERPPLLIVIVDGLRRDVAVDDQIMPWLSARARQDAWFDRARVTAPWTRPSVTSMLTGLTPSEHGLTSEARGRRLSPEVDVLSSVLRNHGYATASFSANPWLGADLGLDRGFGRLMTFQADAADVLYEARLWIEAQRGPWFAVVFLMDTHFPFRHRPEFDRSSDNRAEPLDVGNSAVASAYRRGRGVAVPAAPAAKARELYLENAAYVDRQLGEFVGQVENASPDAVIAITADHGEAFGEHGDFFHGWNLYDELLRVPLLISGAAIDSDNGNVSLRQLPATLLEQAGIDNAIPGPSLTDPAASVAPTFASTRFRGISLDAVLQGRWKLVGAPDGEHCQLYDLGADPAESENLCASRSEVAEALAELLAAHRDGRIFATEEVEPGSAVDRTLRSLGYLDQ